MHKNLQIQMKNLFRLGLSLLLDRLGLSLLLDRSDQYNMDLWGQ